MARNLSLPASVAAKGGIDAWNKDSEELTTLYTMMDNACKATTPAEALREVKAMRLMGHDLFAYAYMRMLYNKNQDVYYGALLMEPTTLLPVVYTPTVGEACQKMGTMPMYRRGCYVSIRDRGNLKAVLEEYAAAEMETGPDGKPMCDCIVFSDAGRILGLGDLGTWGMGIPIGKLDLYTVCAGLDPKKTIPVIIDAGCTDQNGNTAKLLVRDHPLYTGLKQDRVKEMSKAGTEINSAFYGEGNMIQEFMQAATDVFGSTCLLQFEDFNSNDAFPLLAEYREKFLTYNDDIQGTASVCLAGLMGAIKLQQPSLVDLRGELKKEIFLFHGAGAANLGGMKLLHEEVGVPKSQLFVTNSRGVIWKSEDGSEGSFRNEEQKEFAQVGKPSYDSTSLVETIKAMKPSCIIGAVGRDPGCFTKAVVETMVEVNTPKRPVIFALSNPKTQAEITSADCYAWSGGVAIYGSGTKMQPVESAGQMRHPGQVNNVYIFPGMSMGAVCCQATKIPESLFLHAAEAVANSLTSEDMKLDRVVPNTDKIRTVSLNVATAVVLACQEMGLARKTLGANKEEVEAAVKASMWVPKDAAAVAARRGSLLATAESAAPAVAEVSGQLPVDSDLDDHLHNPVGVRAVKVVIDSRRPRYIEQATSPSTDQLASDFANVLTLFGDEPCMVLVRVNLTQFGDEGAPSEASEWVAITYIPSSAPAKAQAQWSSAVASFALKFDDKHFREWKVAEKSEITLETFLAEAGKLKE